MRKYKIILFGSTGMLGSQMISHLSKNKKLQIFEMNRKKKVKSIRINIANQKELINKIKFIKPNYIINCIGWIKQKSINSKEAYMVNTQFPIFLSNLSLLLNYKLIHISTDCVFSGLKGNYKDKDYKDAKDLYGLSKNYGEVKNINTCTLRTSIIGYETAKKKFGLLEWFLSQTDKVNGYDKVYFSGLTTLEMSKVVEKFLLNKKIYNNILNVSSDYISKYNLLKIIKKIFKRDVKLVKSSKIKINRTLNSNKFRKITGYKCPSWKKMISELYLNYKKQ